MKQKLIVVTITALLGSALTALAEDPEQSSSKPASSVTEPGAGIRFRWAMGAFEEGKGMVPVENEITLSTNAAIAMLVEPGPRSYVYVLIETADGEFEWHYPPLTEKDSAPRNEGPYYIPPPPMGLRLGERPGNSRVYVLGSAIPLDRLKAAFLKYETAAPSDKNLFASDLLGELRQLASKTARSANSQSEGVKLALRTGDDSADFQNRDLTSNAAEITAEEFVVRTILVRTR